MKELIRLGTNYGGWWIPASFLEAKEKEVLAVGAGEDISFEVELLNLSEHRITIMDPTPRAQRHYNDFVDSVNRGTSYSINNSDEFYATLDKEKLSRLEYLPLGLWDSTVPMFFSEPRNPSHVSHSIVNIQGTNGGFWASCVDMIELFKNTKRSNFDLVKLDVEGAEYRILEHFIDIKFLPRILCCEFHTKALENGFDEKMNLDSILKNLRSMGYQLLKQESKNYTFIL